MAPAGRSVEAAPTTTPALAAVSGCSEDMNLNGADSPTHIQIEIGRQERHALPPRV